MTGKDWVRSYGRVYVSNSGGHGQLPDFPHWGWPAVAPSDVEMFAGPGTDVLLPFVRRCCAAQGRRGRLCRRGAGTVISPDGRPGTFHTWSKCGRLRAGRCRGEGGEAATASTLAASHCHPYGGRGSGGGGARNWRARRAWGTGTGTETAAGMLDEWGLAKLAKGRHVLRPCPFFHRMTPASTGANAIRLIDAAVVWCGMVGDDAAMQHFPPPTGTRRGRRRRRRHRFFPERNEAVDARWWAWLSRLTHSRMHASPAAVEMATGARSTRRVLLPLDSSLPFRGASMFPFCFTFLSISSTPAFAPPPFRAPSPPPCIP